MKQDQLVWAKLVVFTGFGVDNGIPTEDWTLQEWLSRIWKDFGGSTCKSELAFRSFINHEVDTVDRI